MLFHSKVKSLILYVAIVHHCARAFLNSGGTGTSTCPTSLPRRDNFFERWSSNLQQSAEPDDGYSCQDDSSDFPGGTSSSFQGAGTPRLELIPESIPPLLMTALRNNDIPHVDTGLAAMWEFAGGNTQHVFQNNRTDFIQSAHETANQFPTSFYGAAMYGQKWEMETPLNRVGGDQGWIATQVMKTISSDGRLRRWQWELRKNRRPPNQGVWLVESIGSSDRKGKFEAEED
ncbi:expressed unknown protein [Seminavis robusta]|uniref:Uncharacterized protein n=1 Tax=Seminavis robusta TaxID=568900 RepID=A0A9N8F0J4_9STRA|nr:expressed unknown protein [Seminavis robusta]|eukprot:Sro2463_g328390.1 n/a (231) ;mRNA; f:1605-2297